MVELSKKDEKKSLLMYVAIDQFYKHGMAKTTIASIAKEANIGKSTFYEYFSSKEDVVYFWFVNLLGEMTNLGEVLDGLATNKDKIIQIVGISCGKEFSDSKTMSLFVEFWRLAFSQKDERAIELICVFYNEFSKQLIEYLEDGIKKGEFIECDKEKIASSIMALIDGHWIQYMVDEKYELDSYAKYSIETILKGIQR